MRHDRDGNMLGETHAGHAMPPDSAPSNAHAGHEMPVPKLTEHAPHEMGTAPDTAGALAAVRALHAALVAGDAELVLSLLDEDATIQAGGRRDGKASYARDHLAADIAYARAVRVERTGWRVHVVGDAAWVTSTSRAAGDCQGRTVNASGEELIVVQRRDAVWRLVGIHWSSRPVSAPIGR
ncbi:MAG: nuclear transport factor 2 family protein [Gemmatimonadota bacterium]